MFGVVRYIIMTASICLISLHLQGEEGQIAKPSEVKKCTRGNCSVKSGKSPEVNADNFRCEKFREGGLVELKNKMLENCDLNRPYSSSLTIFAAEETYLYCCHKNASAN